MPTRRIKLTDDFKAALRDLSHPEKDKLLFRLLAKEPALVEKLRFELLEGGDTTELRREELAESMRRRLEEDAVGNFYSPGYLLLDLRHQSARITKHVKATKDKEGEVALNLLLLNTSLPPLLHQIKDFRRGKTVTLSKYVVQRARKILTLLDKLHPDLHVEYADELRTLGRSIAAVEEMLYQAKEQGLDVERLQWGEA